MSYLDFLQIRRDEAEILDQLVDNYIYALDEYGDYQLDEYSKPIIIGEKTPISLNISQENQFHCLNGKDNTLLDHIIHGFHDVYKIDERMKNATEAKPLMAVLYKDIIYQGSVWFWTNDKYIGLFGIRTSIQNAILGVKGTARELFNLIEEISDGRQILVYWPLLSIEPLLIKLGFHHCYPNGDPDKIKFLQSIGWHAIDYWTK